MDGRLAHMSRRTWIIVGLLMSVFAIGIGALQWWKYTTFGYNGLDLGIYTQTVWSLAHGHGFASSIHDPSYLGDHAEAWLIPISWLYRLWESPLLLLWLQTIVLSSAAIPLAKIVRRALNERAVVIATTLFLLHPFMYNAGLYEFHGLIFAIPILLWSIWWYSERHWAPWTISLVALAVTREDMPIVIAGWALLACIERRTRRWWIVAVLIALTWFPIAQMIIRSANHDGVYKYLAFYGWMGNSLPEIMTYPFRHPLVFLSQIISLNNFGTILGLLAPAGFLPLLRGKKLWPVLFITLQLLIGNAQPGTFLRIHYTLPFLPFLIWASIEAYVGLRSGEIRLWKLSPMVAKLVGTSFIIISPIYASLIVGPAEWPWSGIRREPGTDVRTLQAAVNNVEPGDRVLTSFSLLPNLANRTSLYSLNYVYLGRRQYSEIPYHLPTDVDAAVIDWQQLYEFQYIYRTTVFEHQSGIQRITNVLDEQGLRPVLSYGTVVVYRRDGRRTPVEVPTASNQVSRYNKISLVGELQPSVVAHTDLGWTSLSVRGTWSITDPIHDEYFSIRYILTKNNVAVWQHAVVLGQMSQPSSEWQPNTNHEVIDDFPLPKKLSGTYELHADIIQPRGRYRLNRLRTFRPIIDTEKILGSRSLGTVSI